jgi:hypothetical protein
MNPVKTPENKDVVKVDPIVELHVGDEVYVMVYDYRVATAITRATGFNPLVRGLYPILETVPEAVEMCLWAMLTQMQDKWPVPKDQRNLKREEIREWLEDLEFAQSVILLMFDAMVKAMPKKQAEVEDENSANPQTNPPVIQ